jgi:hypothetical protein
VKSTNLINFGMITVLSTMHARQWLHNFSMITVLSTTHARQWLHNFGMITVLSTMQQVNGYTILP